MKTRMKRSLIAIVGLLAVTVSGPAAAGTIAGITFPAGAVLDIGTIWENIIFGPGPGETLGGIGIVDVIKDGPGGTVFWTAGDNGRELTFVFGGFFVEKITVSADGMTAVILFSGGFADLFSDVDGDFDITEATATNGTPFLNLVAVGGGIVCDGTCFHDGITVTLVGNVLLALSGDLGSVLSGGGNTFFDVFLPGPGLANANFDTNSFLGGQDFLLGSTFSDTGGPKDFPLVGAVTLKASAIPEPEALAIFGIGLLGMGLVARRRRRIA